MAMGQVFGIAASIVSVGLVFVLVSNSNTAKIITAFGNAFTGGLKAAMGG